MAESFPDPRRLAIAAERYRLELQWLSQDHAIDGWERSYEDWALFLAPGVTDQCRHTLEAAWRRQRVAEAVVDAWRRQRGSTAGEELGPRPRHHAIHFWHALIAFLFADNVSLEDDRHH